MPIEISSRQRKFPLPLDWLSMAAKLASAELEGSKKTISIVFVNDRTIRKINKQYRNKANTTDVLSFRYEPEPVPDPAEFPGGEILISVETASRQASESGIPLMSELLNLIIHGLCHVFGYDHEKGKREADRMRKMERHIAGRLVNELCEAPGIPRSDSEFGIRGKIPDPKETRES